MDCLDIIKKSIPDATQDELSEVLGMVNQRFAKIMQEGTTTADDAVRQASKEVADKVKMAALIEKRNAAINRNIKIKAVDFIKTSFPDMPIDGVEALLVGSKFARKGARLSVDNAQRVLERKYLSAIERGLKKDDLYKLVSREEIQGDIARAIFNIDNPEALKNYPPEAVQIAKVLHDVQELARKDANKAGAWIGKLDGYITRQTHDEVKMTKAGVKAWSDVMKQHIDLNKMFPDGAPDNLDKWLEETYKAIVTGKHGDTSSEKAAAFKGPANLAKKLSQERVIHFKDADAWIAYNNQFGRGRVFESIISGIQRKAQQNGMMKVLGTNPRSNMDFIISEAEKASDLFDEKVRSHIRTKKDTLDKQYKTVSGEINNPVNHMMARRFSNLRSGVRLSTLGGSLLSSIMDPVVRASELRYQGKNYLQDLSESFADIFKGIGNKERKAAALELETYSEDFIGAVANRFDPEDSVGSGLKSMERFFFRINGMTPWSDLNRGGSTLAIAEHIANYHGRSWSEVHPNLQRVLSFFDIGEKEWAVINKAQLSEDGGKRFLTPENLDAIDEKIADKYRSFLADRIDTAYIHPGAQTQATMTQGLQPGTLPGEAIRSIFQLKTFPIAMLQRVISRELYGYGKKSLKEIGSSEIRGMASLVIGMTVMGYIAMSAKDLVKGRNPRPLTDENGKPNLSTLTAAMLQGGAWGVYGDLIFARDTRVGGAVETLSGPLVSKGSELFGLIQSTAGKLKEGEVKSDLAAKWLRTAVSNTPFNNVFWMRPIADYAILYEVQESLSPGYLKRMEARAKKDNQQTYWLSPSEVAR